MPAAPGTRPAGVPEPEIAGHVRAMFDRIAPTYDRANHLLSFSLDRYWRWRTVRRLRARLALPGPVLDLCCGTGDLARALARGLEGRPVLAADFSRPMLARAREKIAGGACVQADALRLPFPSASLAAITLGFGFRNLRDYRAGLAELFDRLAPGGWLAILEAAEPTLPGWAQFYRFYFHQVLPRLGGWISGQPEAYRYLPASVGRFPAAAELAEWMRQAGFTPVQFCQLAGGAATLHLAQRPPA